MAYTRKAAKPDIRSLNLSSLSPSSPTPSKTPEKQPVGATHDVLTHNPHKEMKQILWCSLPLMLLCALADYLDTTQPWVVPLAERLLRTGS